MDYILNGQATGSVASRLMQNNWDVGALRPFIDDQGRSCVLVNQGGKLQKLVTNAPTALRKDAWIQLDTDIVMAARQRLKLVGALRAANLVYRLPSGMSKTVLQTETASDIEDATISMEPTTEDRADEMQYDLVSLPLPVVHKGFHYTARQIATHQQEGTPLDTSHGVAAAVRVAEKIEKLALGTAGSYQYGGGNVYGMINYPQRITTTITIPTDADWLPRMLVTQILGLKELMKAALQYGPYMLYFGTAWDAFLDDDYSQTKASDTLRNRVRMIEGIEGVETLDFLPGYQLVMVQKSTNTVRMVVGFDVITVQWETFGGLKVNHKVIGMMVPQVRSDFYGRCGVLHATAVPLP